MGALRQKAKCIVMLELLVQNIEKGGFHQTVSNRNPFSSVKAAKDKPADRFPGAQKQGMEEVKHRSTQQTKGFVLRRGAMSFFRSRNRRRAPSLLHLRRFCKRWNHKATWTRSNARQTVVCSRPLFAVWRTENSNHRPRTPRGDAGSVPLERPTFHTDSAKSRPVQQNDLHRIRA